MKKLITTAIFLAVAVAAAQAQQDHHYTQFMYNKLALNPAYAGERNTATMSLIYRNQWINFKGAPKSLLASFHTPIFSPRVGFGLTVSNQQIGIHNDLNVAMAYSYKLVETDELAVRGGLQGAFRSLGMDFEKANPLTLNDQSLDDKRMNEYYGNFGAGVYAVLNEKYYFGVSVPRILENVIGLNNGSAQLQAVESQHFYFMTGGIFPLNEDLSLLASGLLKFVRNAPLDADLNVNLEFRKKMSAGFSYRVGGDGPGDSFDLLLYWQASDRLGFGAAYDLTISSLGSATAGTVELLAQADLGKKRGYRMSNPRFFF